MKFGHTIRGVEIYVTADSFDGDESVGVGYGPEEVSAVREDDGTDFTLTDEEVEELSIIASKSYYDDTF